MIKLDKNLREAIDTVAEITRKKIMGDDKTNDKLFEKIQDYGIEIFAINSDEFDGFSIWNDEKKQPQIYVDVPSQTESRRRFTVAHELGHIVLDHKWNPFTKARPKDIQNDGVISVLFRDKDKENDTKDYAERKANEFAGAFLMPRANVEELVGIDDTENDKIATISKFFGVTMIAAKNRLDVLGLL